MWVYFTYLTVALYLENPTIEVLLQGMNMKSVFPLLPLIIQIIYLLSRVIQSNSYKRPAESCSGRPAECDVIHEGLLDLQQNTSTSTEWVKYELWIWLQFQTNAFGFECADNKLIL